jgi:hypothetical protein
VLYGLRPRPVNLVLRFFKRYVRRNIPQYVLGLVMLVATNYAVVRVPTLIGAPSTPSAHRPRRRPASPPASRSPSS